ncbi:MAG: ATP-binding protein [bacterium]
MPDTIQREDREYRAWLYSLERRAIIPLKLIIWCTSAALWYWRPKPWVLPDTEVFVIFLLYFMSLVFQSYFFFYRRPADNQIKSFCYGSYFADLIFVTLLIYFDQSLYFGRNLQSDFYIFYFLLILRGFALFRTRGEHLLMNLLLSLVFIFTLWTQEKTWAFMTERGFAFKIALIWLVILASWFIVEIINSQKVELLKTRENLLRSQHLATLGEMAAGVAHEINNPIGVISAYAEYLLRNVSKSDPRREDYEAIRTEARRCERIVQELLDYSRVKTEEFSLESLGDLNDEVLAFVFHDKTKDNIEIVKNYEANLPRLLLDKNQIKQALLNIYLNAIQAMNGKGRLELNLSKSRGGPERVVLEICDDGPGISAEDLPRVFEPFFTRKRGGTGLGLPITRRSIENHNGTVEAIPLQPHGTMVRVELPVLRPVSRTSAADMETTP